MSSKRTWLWGILILAVAAVIWYRQSVFQSPAPPTITNVAFVTGGSGPYWQMTVSGARAAAEEYNANLEVGMPDHEESVAEQMKLLIGIDKNKVDGIAISPLDAESQTHLINKIVESHPVVTFDSDAPLSNRRYYVGTSNYAAGQMCHKLISEALPEGGEVVILLANLSKRNTIDRKLGFEEAAKENVGAEGSSPIELVDVLVDEGNKDTCQQNIRKALADHPDLDGFIAMNGYHGPVLLDALEQEDRLGELQIVAFDEHDATLNGIAEGHIFATVAQDPYMYGYEAVRMLFKLNSGEDTAVPIVGGGVVHVQCEAVRKDNLDSFRERLQNRMKGAASQSSDKTDADDAAASGAGEPSQDT